jgi:hypothetical protein
MNLALTVARLAYVVVGLAALVVGWDRWERGDSSATLVLLAGGLALAAAAWVTSDGVIRGAAASIGIVVGAVTVAMTSFLLAAFLIGFGGDPARATLAAIPIPIAVPGAWVMWRCSKRPWDRPPSR